MRRNARSVTATLRQAARHAALGAALAGGMGAAVPAVAGGLYEPEPFARSFTVGIDQSVSLHLTGPAALVAVGNPSIADALVQDRDLLLLVGRSFGATNVIVFAEDGEEIASFVVNVVDAAPQALTLSRGTARRTYNCAPQCERVYKIGDASDESEVIAKQTGQKMGLATQGAEATQEGSNE